MDEVKIIWSDFALDQIEKIASDLEKESFWLHKKWLLQFLKDPNN